MKNILKNIKYYLSIKDKIEYDIKYKNLEKEKIITEILEFCKHQRKAYFIANNYFTLTKQNVWSKQKRKCVNKDIFKNAYSLYQQIDDISFEQFLKIQRQLYINEHVHSNEYRAYIHYIRQTSKLAEENMNILLKEYYITHLKMTKEEADIRSKKQQKGKKVQFSVAARKIIPLANKIHIADKDILSLLSKREMQLILNNYFVAKNKRISSITLQQKMAFIKNSHFFNKVINFLLSYNHIEQKIDFLPNAITENMIAEINKLKKEWEKIYKPLDN